MGKLLMIKGADFSANGMPGVITWWQQSDVVDGASIESTGLAGGLGLVLSDALNKPINIVRFRFRSDNSYLTRTFAIFKVTKGTTTQSSEITPLATFTISSVENAAGVKQVILDSLITLTSANDTLLVGFLGNEVDANIKIPVAYSTTSSYKHAVRMTSGGYSTASETTAIGAAIDYGYIE